MEGGLANCDIRALSNLLNPLELRQENDDSDIDDGEVSGAAKMTPGSVGPPLATKQRTAEDGAYKSQAKDENAIWADHEVLPLQQTASENDPRPAPSYEVIYKQSIGAEDVFLGLGNRTPATASCEDMVVVIDVPDTKSSDMQLDVSDTFLDFETPRLKLGIPLPHPVDSKNGKAKWDPKKSQLAITLRMKREYDFMNF